MTSGPWVRALLVGAGALVLGLVLGGLGPRAEVRRLQDRVFELEREAARQGPGLSREIANILTNPGGVAGGPVVAPAATSDAGDPSRPSSTGPDPRRVAEGDEEGPEQEKAPERLGDELGRARDLLAMRAAQARAALYEDIDPTGEQEARIEQVVDEMNDQLYTVTRDFLERTRSGEVLPRRDTMALGADVLDILTTAESRMLDQMTPTQRDLVREEATDPTSFVDPGLLDMVAEYEDLPERLRAAGGEGGP